MILTLGLSCFTELDNVSQTDGILSEPHFILVIYNSTIMLKQETTSINNTKCVLNQSKENCNFKVWHLLGEMLQGREVGHAAQQWQVSLMGHACFCEKSSVVGQTFVPATCCMKFSWLNLCINEEGTKPPQFSMLHCVHCSCKLSPQQQRNEPTSTLRAPAWVSPPNLHHLQGSLSLAK